MISVFIPTYLDQNEKYLQAAVNAVLAQDVPLEVIVVSDRKVHPEFSDERVKVLKLPQRTRFCPKNNLAARSASKDSTHFLLLNDDTLMTRGSLKEMLKADELYPGALIGALSNCDNGPLYRKDFIAHLGDNGKFPIAPQFNFSEAEPFLDFLFEYRPYSESFVFETPRLFFFNVLMKRRTWHHVGQMDEEYLNSCDDFDYCIRAKKIGYKLVVQQSAFCFHFSGKTSGVTATSEERIKDQIYFEKKHGIDVLRVL